MDGENIVLPNQNEIQENKRKHRYSNCETEKFDFMAAVKEKTENEAPENKFFIEVAPFRLLDFCDEVLFEIFKYLDSWSLMALMTCCTRLSSLILDHRFWNHIDLSKEPLPLGILEDILERSQGNTKCIKLHGPPIAQHLEREDKQFSQTLAKSFTNCCINLQILELQGITIDFRYVRITDFPRNLKKLLLNNCNVRFEGEKSIFFGIDTHLISLEELGIENSDWFEPYYMMVFSKMPKLHSLSLKGCKLLSDFVPYGSMAARHGFKKLEFLDLRYTPINDSDLQCFNAVATLKEILLDCPETMREDNEDSAEDTKTKVRNCYCHSRQNSDVNSSTSASTSSSSSGGTADVNSDSPSTSNAASRLRITVSISPGNKNDSGASTSAAAAARDETREQVIESAAGSTAREEDSSLSSCSSSPSGSSSSSNESAPPLLRSISRAYFNSLELPLPGANAPPFSRFLPRPDQIILLDLNNRYRRVVMQSVPINRENGGDDQQQQPQPQEQGPLQEPEPEQEPVQQLQQEPEPGQQPSSPQDAYEARRKRQHQIVQDRMQQRLRAKRQKVLQEPIVPEQQRNNRNQNNNNNINNDNNINPNPNLNPNPNNNVNQIERVISHRLFWDMINPFVRIERGGMRRSIFGCVGNRDDDNADSNENSRRFECRRTQCSGQYHQYHRHGNRSHHHPISDRGLCSFGRARNPVERGIIRIRIENRPNENRFERLSIRNYKLVTDVSLQHLVQCSPYLNYIDVSGTSVTQRGVDAFKKEKPQCIIIVDHLSQVDDDDDDDYDESLKKSSCDGGSDDDDDNKDYTEMADTI